MSEKFVNWCGDVTITNTMGAGWCVRIDGCDVFDEINKHGVKPRRSIQIAGGLHDKAAAQVAAMAWLNKQFAQLSAQSVAAVQPVAEWQWRADPDSTWLRTDEATARRKVSMYAGAEMRALYTHPTDADAVDAKPASLLRDPTNSAPSVCYCKPGKCSAPQPNWCRDPAKAQSTEGAKG